MHIQRKSLYFIRLASDLIGLFIAFILSVNLTTTDYYPFKFNEHYLFAALIIIWMYSSQPSGLYNEFRSRNFSDEIVITIKVLLIQSIAVIIILYTVREISLTRFFAFMFSILSFSILIIEKLVLRKTINYMRKKGRNIRKILIIGAGEVGKNFYDTIMSNPQFGYRLVGFLDDQPKTFLNGQYLGNIDNLEEILKRREVNDAIIALPNHAADRIEGIINICENYTVRVKIIPDYFRFVSDKYELTQFGRFPIISVRNEEINDITSRMEKRIFDFVFTSFLFIFVLWWVMGIIAIAIKLSSKGKVFFKQERWGRNNEKILCYKFRSMIETSVDVDDTGKYNQAQRNDPRITKIGKFIRKTNLDELPQFINVLKGNMSIVGPRPHPTPLNLESRDKIQSYMMRHLVKPGITGWAQVNGYRGGTEDPMLMQSRIDHDLWYIENWSIWLDIKIVIMTVWNMVKGERNAY
jgi:putative colanic acid biosynthesis UDP-glucose lipid carrier transferase